MKAATLGLVVWLVCMRSVCGGGTNSVLFQCDGELSGTGVLYRSEQFSLVLADHADQHHIADLDDSGCHMAGEVNVREWRQREVAVVLLRGLHGECFGAMEELVEAHIASQLPDGMALLAAHLSYEELMAFVWDACGPLVAANTISLMPSNGGNATSDARSRLQEMRHSLRAVDEIEALVSKVSTKDQEAFLSVLTSIHTRLSSSPGAINAAYYLQGLLQGMGLAPFQYHFEDGFAPNVIAEIEGSLEPDKVVVIGAHYDCRMSDIRNETARAPGANDDGSGTAMLYELARVFTSADVKLRYTLRFAFFAGEEQGLVGSRAYASDLKSQGVDVVGMLQGDMIAYNAPGEPPQTDLPLLFATPELTLLMANVSELYVPGLKVGATTACCSDQQSFYENGFPATAFAEGGGYTIDPAYHRTYDVTQRPGYDWEQLRMITQLAVAGAAVLAELV